LRCKNVLIIIIIIIIISLVTGNGDLAQECAASMLISKSNNNAR